MLSGCQYAVREAHSLSPELAGAVVKWPQGARAGSSLSGEAAQRLVEETAERACRALAASAVGGLPAALVRRPVRIRLQCQGPAFADLFSLWPAVRRETGESAAADTVRFECVSVHDAVRSLNALSAMSAALR